MAIIDLAISRLLIELVPFYNPIKFLHILIRLIPMTIDYFVQLLSQILIIGSGLKIQVFAIIEKIAEFLGAVGKKLLSSYCLFEEAYIFHRFLLSFLTQL
jgi:hypothetical protein